MNDRVSSGRGPRLFGFGATIALAFLGAAAGTARADAGDPAAVAAPAVTRGAGPSQAPEAKPGSPAQSRARRMFQDAEAHFQAGLFAEALGEYQAGYDAAALPGFLINIAQCQRRLGNLTGALTTYRKFIMVAPDSPYVPEVQSLVADLDKLARDAERERDRERAASARPGARAKDAGGSRGPAEAKRSPALESASSAALTTAPAAASEPPALIDRPGAGAVATPDEKESAGRSSSTRWWWIGGVGALVAIAGGAVAVLALRSGDSTTLHEGSLGSVRR